VRLEREVANLTDAIASGELRASPAIAGPLQEAESALANLTAARAMPSVEELLPQLAAKCSTALERLDQTLAKDPRRARLELAEQVGPIRVRTTPAEIVLEAQKGHMESVMLAPTGTDGPRQISLVAGARCTLFHGLAALSARVK
jgi:hypothetical protein